MNVRTCGRTLGIRGGDAHCWKCVRNRAYEGFRPVHSKWISRAVRRPIPDFFRGDFLELSLATFFPGWRWPKRPLTGVVCVGKRCPEQDAFTSSYPHLWIATIEVEIATFDFATLPKPVWANLSQNATVLPHHPGNYSPSPSIAGTKRWR